MHEYSEKNKSRGTLKEITLQRCFLFFRELISHKKTQQANFFNIWAFLDFFELSGVDKASELDDCSIFISKNVTEIQGNLP